MKGTKLTNKHTVLVRDETLYDAELSLAVANLNAVKNSIFPKFAYVGIAWAGNAQTKDQIVANVEEVFTEHVKAAIARNEYAPVSLPPSLLSRPVLQSSSPPSLKLDLFELTQPTANNELHWRFERPSPKLSHVGMCCFLTVRFGKAWAGPSCSRSTTRSSIPKR